LPRADFGPTLDSFNRVPKDAVAAASNAGNGGGADQ